MTAREAALQALLRCHRGGAWSDAVLDGILQRGGLDRRDAALATRICYGVQQNRTYLDFVLEKWCRQPLRKLEPVILELLRLSAYQLLFLDKIPASAVVDEAVKLAKAQGRGSAAGLVNAVLRRVAENSAPLPEPPAAGTSAYLALRYSHPQWLTELLIAQEGYAQTEAFFRENNGIPPVCLQVNPLRTTGEALLAALEKQGFSVVVHPWLPGCLLAAGAGGLMETAQFLDGQFYVQDAAAVLAVLAAGPAPGMQVLDACAAPGGKSFAAAIAMGDSGAILACDIQEKKLGRLEDSARRLGFSCIRTAPMDARRPAAALRERFDLVMADVPCSGLGVIRKKPDIREKRPEDLEALPTIQGDILDGLADCVRPGGVLLYSTCTVLHRENDAVVDAFLVRRQDFVREAVCLPAPVGRLERGSITLWPQIHGTDGFYFCKLRRAL